MILLIFRDILEKPTDFIYYLDQRLKLNENSILKSGDEIDFLGYYLNEGKLDLAKDSSTGGAILNAFSEEIDRYFGSLEYDEISYEKPKKKQKNNKDLLGKK